MNYLSLIASFSLCAYLFLGILILLRNPKSKQYQLFFYMCMSMSIWILCYAFYQFAETSRIAELWYKLCSFGFVPYFAFVLHFIVVLTNRRIKKFVAIILYLSTVLLIVMNIRENIVYSEFYRVKSLWRVELAVDSVWFYVFVVFVYCNLFASSFLLSQWGRESKSVKRKRQAAILLTTLNGTIVGGSFLEFILPIFFDVHSTGYAPLYLMIWMIGVWYSILKYKMMVISPPVVCEELIENIDESIVLLDIDLNIRFINTRTRDLISCELKCPQKLILRDFILEDESISREIQKMINQGIPNFACRLHYTKQNKETTLMDCLFKIIRDTFNDIVGIMIIGREVKELKHFKTVHNITDREAEIVQQIINGLSNREIALSLGITQNTMKRHIGNIYCKLNVKNKIELLNLLKGFHLIPAQPSEKTLLIFK